MDFWRSEAYMQYFEFLEEKGGFYEVWPYMPNLFSRLSVVAKSAGEMHQSIA